MDIKNIFGAIKRICVEYDFSEFYGKAHYIKIGP
jgi:hypothetical protein